MSVDISSFLAGLKLSEADQIELKAVLDSEQISALQILRGVVTLDELEEVGVRANVLDAIRKEIDEFQARKKAEEEKQVFSIVAGYTRFNSLILRDDSIYESFDCRFVPAPKKCDSQSA